ARDGRGGTASRHFPPASLGRLGGPGGSSRIQAVPTPRAALAPRRGPRRPAQRLGPPRPREARGAWCSWTPRSACQRMGGSGGVPPWDVSLNSPSDWGRRRSDHDQDAAGSCRPRSRSRSTPADADSPG
ncbi:unnamed protein product, partial [Prorocentrum cordatum]